MSEHAGDPSALSESADPETVRELADIPAVEVISRAAVMLMSSAAEKLGLADSDPDTSPRRDLDELLTHAVRFSIVAALAGV